MRKMEHRSRSRRSHGNEAMGRSIELRIQRQGSGTRAGSCPRAPVEPPKLIQRLYLGELSLCVSPRPRKWDHGALLGASVIAPGVFDVVTRQGSPRPIRRLYLDELMLWLILGRSKMISTPFLHQKCAKWNTAGGATETTPPPAPRGLTASPGPAMDHLSSSVDP